MAQTSQLLSVLKKSLKANGKTYADVAKALDLTEASIKRLFSEKQFTLQRLDAVCQLLEIEISDLVQMMNEQTRRISELSREQEAEIIKDVKLLLVAVCVLNRWTMEDILLHYDLQEAECITRLATLDRLGLIELQPNNRIKILVAPNFHWQDSGPIQKFFRDKVESEFFNSSFSKSTEKLYCLNGMVSRSSNAVFQRKMERLAAEFNELNDDDAGLPIRQRFGTSVVLAIRQWQFRAFEHLVRR